MIGFDYLILTNSKVPNDVAYKTAKALHQNKKALIAAHGVFRGYNPKLINKKGCSKYGFIIIKFFWYFF